jgi:phage terminase large subunit GpA-like protein
MTRDYWKCRRCGYRQTLQVHHIIFRSEMGEDVTWNLITLCSTCHEDIHKGKLYIVVPEGNFVGEGGGADGEVRFVWS